MNFKFKPGFIPIPIIAAIAALVVTASATIFGQIAQEGRQLEFVGQTITLTATPSCDGQEAIIGLFWNQLPQESGYDVIRNGSSIGTTSFFAFTDRSVTAGTTYTYTILGQTTGTSSASTQATALTICSQPPPSPSPVPQPTPQPTASPSPTPGTATINLTALPNCAGPNAHIGLFWNQVAGETQYNLFRSTGGSFELIKTTDFPVYTDTQVTAGSNYFYQVAGQVTGSLSNTFQITAPTTCGGTGQPPPSPSPTPSPTPLPGQANNPPGAVTIVGPSTGNIGQTLTYSLRATDPDGDSLTYRACWDTNGDGIVDQQAECRQTGQVGSGSEVAMQAAWPTAGTFFFFAIAFDGKGYGQWSWQSVVVESADGIIPTPQPSPAPTPITPSPTPTPIGSPTTPPGNFTLGSPDNGTTNFTNDPSFSWGPASGATHYWIYLGQPGLGWHWTKKTPTNNAYWDRGAGWQTCTGCPAKDRPQTLPAGQWSWWVAAENSAGATWADIGQGPFTFTVSAAGGIPSPTPSPSPPTGSTPSPTPTASASPIGTVGPSPTGSPATNRPPNKPVQTADFQTFGNVGQVLTLYLSFSDPDGDSMSVYVDWGNNQFSSVPGIPNNFIPALTNSWSEPGQYKVRAKAIDTKLAESDWSDPIVFTVSGSGTATTCTTVRNNGDPAEKLDVTFVPIQYSQSELDLFVQDVNLSVNKLLFYQPFSQKSHLFNFHRVDLPFFAPEDLFSLDVLRVARTCPYDKIIMIVNRPTTNWGASAGIGSTMAYLNRLELNLSAGSLVAHEFGHIFGALADEYISGGPEPPAHALNCSKSADSPPWREYPGTNLGITGCTVQHYYRPTENSLMRSNLSFNNDPSGFGPWNIKLLNDKLGVYE